MMSKCHLLAFYFLLFPNVTNAQESWEQRVDPLFRSYEGDVPGAAVLLVKNGETLLRKGYGLADVEEKIPVTRHTNFRLASLSKAFTALAVMILVEDGRIDLNGSLQGYIPDFPNYGRSITVKHLLQHTAGMIDYEDLVPPSQETPVTDADVVNLLKKQSRTYFTPGSSYRYSNGGYATLAHLVALQSGMPFQDFMKEKIFTPLVMEESVEYVPEWNDVVERAYGYTQNGSGFRRTDQSVTSAVLGDGGVYSSVKDLYKWIQFWESGNAIISSETKNLMLTKGRLSNNQSFNYGFGWVIDQYKGHQRISHTGSTIGQRHAIQWFPEKKVAVVVLMNRASVTPWDKAAQIADMILNL